MRFVMILLTINLFSNKALAASEVRMNCCTFQNSPKWFSKELAEPIVARIQEKLNWDIRRITVKFTKDQNTYRSESRLNFPTDAYFDPNQQIVAIAPHVTSTNSAPIFGHELVHVIFKQKYKNAIPRWLEEGLANYLGSERQVDYRWLKSQPIKDITRMEHPNSENMGHRYHYQLSTAVTEMIATKCNLNDLLMLSVGKKLENYLSTFCKIDDINASTRAWISEKSENSEKKRH